MGNGLVHGIMDGVKPQGTCVIRERSFFLLSLSLTTGDTQQFSLHLYNALLAQ
jgi:hypothetical protein